MWICPLSFGLMVIINGLLELSMWHLVWSWNVNILHIICEVFVVCEASVADMAGVWNLEILADKFNVDGNLFNKFFKEWNKTAVLIVINLWDLNSVLQGIRLYGSSQSLWLSWNWYSKEIIIVDTLVLLCVLWIQNKCIKRILEFNMGSPMLRIISEL